RIDMPQPHRCRGLIGPRSRAHLQPCLPLSPLPSKAPRALRMGLHRAAMVEATLPARPLPPAWRQEAPRSSPPLSEARPGGLAPAPATALAPMGCGVLDPAARPRSVPWWRGGVRASGKSVGPGGEAPYPVVKSGEALAAAPSVGGGHAYRD